MSVLQDNNPFVGLRPFESSESLLFFGRQEQTLELLQRLHQHQFVAVTGSSGSGKSSLIRAGLIPKLKAGFLVNNSDRWIITTMRPGQTPMCNLAEAILSEPSISQEGLTATALYERIKEKGVDAVLEILQPLWPTNTNFFLLVDQFEELFRFAFYQNNLTRKDEAKDFVNVLLAMAEQKTLPIYIVITMRSDFIGDCSLIYGLPEALNKSQYVVPRLNRLQLKSSIEGPVKLFRGKINSVLTARLLNDVQLINDELPLLQHVLMRIWDHEETISKSGELDLDDYNSMGGIENALSNHADEAYHSLTNEEQEIAQRMFQSLTAIDQNGRKIRRPVQLSELEIVTGSKVENLLKVIKKFIERKRFFLVITPLLGTNNFVIDISHESLIRQWNRLNIWVDEEAEAGKTMIRLSDTRQRFEKETKQINANQRQVVLKGLDLQIALQWLHTFQPNTVWAQRYVSDYEKTENFIRESEREWHSELDKEKKEQKLKQRNRKLLLAGLIGVCLIISGFAYAIYRNAQANKKQLAFTYWNNSQAARRQGIHLAGLHFTAEALTLSNNVAPTKNMMIDIRPSLPVASLEAIFSFPDFILCAAFQPGSQRLALAGNDGSVRIINLETNEDIMVSRRHDLPINSIVFAPNGQWLLTGSNDGTARVWNAASGKEIFSLSHSGFVLDAVYNNDGQQILTVSTDSTLRIWNAATGKEAGSFHHSESIVAGAFSPDGRWIVGIDRLGTILRWNVFTKQKDKIKENLKPTDAASISFSRDSKRFVATISTDPVIDVWDMETKLPLLTIPHPSEIRFSAFSLDDRYIVTTGKDGYVRFWNPVSGLQMGAELKHEGPAFHVAFREDKTTLATMGWDKTIRIWKTPFEPIGLKPILLKHHSSVNMATFSSDGKLIASASSDSTARIWEVGTQKQLTLLPHSNEVKSVLFNPDGTHVLTTGEDGVLRLWDVKTGQQLKETHVTEPITLATYSSDGRIIVTDGSNSHIQILDAANLQLMHSFFYAASVTSIALSHDGKTLLLSVSDSTARLLALPSGKELASFRHEDAVTGTAFRPDGNAVVTASFDFSARLWDLATKKQIGLAMKHTHAISTVAFSADGKWIATTSFDGTTRLWDVLTQKELGILLKKESGFNSAVFSPDGKSLLVAGGDGNVSLIEVATDLDMPADLFKLQAKALTGTELNFITGETQCLQKEVWEKLKHEYSQKGKAHASVCKYPAYNTWQRIYTKKVNKAQR